MTEEDIVEINKILELCGASKLNTNKDVNYLTALGLTVESECDKYSISQVVLLDRLKNQTGERNYGQLTRLRNLATAAGCPLEQKEPEAKKQTTVFFGGRA